MSTKSNKGGIKATTMTSDPSQYDSMDESFIRSRWVNLSLLLIGDPPGPGEWQFLALFNDVVVVDNKWVNGAEFKSNNSVENLEAISIAMPHINLADAKFQNAVAEKPLILLLRSLGAKPVKETDPLLHPNNHSGGNVDLFPLVLGENQVYVVVPFCSVTSGEVVDCSVQVLATTTDISESYSYVPLTITMVSAHCLPQAKEGTFYVSAVGLHEVCLFPSINLGLSLNSPYAKKIVWASASNAGYAADTKYNVPTEDVFFPPDMIGRSKPREDCRSFYWYSMKRALVDPEALKTKLSRPFMIEMAGVPRAGKLDVRGRYMAFVDLKVLLEPGERSVTTAANLLFFSEANIPEDMGVLLDLPPMSAKGQSARDTQFVQDEYGHDAYVVIRFDLTESLVPKVKLDSLYEIIGFLPPTATSVPYNKLDVSPVPEDPFIDARRIRKEGGALAVHKELCKLSCKGPINQGLKRSAANKLLIQVRTMLKGFSPGDCSYIEWQDTVTGQHAASRRAVTSSFAPQPPAPKPPPLFAEARCRMAGDNRIADAHMKMSLKAAGGHPRSLMAKTLRCLENRDDVDAKNYLLEGLRKQTRSRYLLWILGAQEFDKEPESVEMAGAAFRIAVKGEHSDGTSNAIGWAALHAFHVFNNNVYAAFVAAKKMHKAFTLPVQWKKMLELWSNTSGQEEIFWLPSVIASDNPMVCAAAFFLCLRCYKFSEHLIQCVEKGSSTGGSPTILKTPDIYYLRAASLLLRRQHDIAMKVTLEGVKKYGPTAIMSQMQVSCYICLRGWTHECEMAFKEAERAGSELPPAILYRAAFSCFKTRSAVALQRVARAHMITPSAHTALLIGRIYMIMGEENLAERWLASAVRLEPLLADAWAILALLAIYQRDKDKAKHMLRTARQVGPVSPDIEKDITKMSEVIGLEKMPDAMTKNLCFCDYVTTTTVTEFKI